MNRSLSDYIMRSANEQACDVLANEILQFVLQSGVTPKRFQQSVSLAIRRKNRVISRREYSFITRAYEDMGTVLSTWFNSPEFLNADGSPICLTLREGKHSLSRLLASAKVRISLATAVSLLSLSPSVTVNNGKISANRRVFVIPSLGLVRAALVIPRYLDTLSLNSNAHRSNTIKLLERQCSASSVDSMRITPILRNIKEQGGSFVDSIDGQIESSKLKRSNAGSQSEIGLLVFAWTRKLPRKANRTRRKLNSL
jgi:hypothetical protein